MYKIACFRDDVIFIIWIFQCFIYPVDPTRANEFGLIEKEQISNEEEEGKEEEEEDQGKLKKNKEQVDGKLKTD